MYPVELRQNYIFLFIKGLLSCALCVSSSSSSPVARSPDTLCVNSWLSCSAFNHSISKPHLLAYALVIADLSQLTLDIYTLDVEKLST